ncbi:MAG: ferritin [Acidimicrobiia bacterium]|nr:MAG: ferritin [Acidimicrobiia bacterium]
MQLTEKMAAEFNRQLTMELDASHAYLAMAGWLEQAGFPGFASWMRMQSEEERLHALKIYQFILDRDSLVAIGSLNAPKSEFSSVIDVYESALHQEREVTASLSRMYGLANSESDFASLPILQWFVNEQIEEESTMTQIIDDLRLAEGNPQAFLLLDRELGARVAPTPV